MSQEKTKVYTYTRVSTAMQIDGYSLDAQKARMKAYADFNDYQIVGEYEDAGKSGKSIEGRASFCKITDGALGITCPNCGAPITNLGAKFCEYCGAGVVELNVHAWSFENIEEA